MGNARATIWYFSLEFLSQCWPFFLQQDGTPPGHTGLQLWERALLERRCTIQSTHVEVGRVHCDAKNAKTKQTWLKGIFAAMQASNWSPDGEARGLMMKKKLTHTSMSIGDAVQIGSELYVAGIDGFVAVKDAKALLPLRAEEDDQDGDNNDDDDVQEETPRRSEEPTGKKKKRKKNKGKGAAGGGEGGQDSAANGEARPAEEKGGKAKGKGKGKKGVGAEADKAADGAQEAPESGGGKRKKRGKGQGKGGGDAGNAKRDKEEAGAGPDRIDRRALRSELQAHPDRRKTVRND